MRNLILSFASLLSLVLLVASSINGSIVTTEVAINEETANSVELNNNLDSPEEVNLKERAVDWGTAVVTAFSTPKNEETGERELSKSWQKNSFATFYKFLNASFLTDCTFFVGPDGQEEKIEAHSVILAAASPLLSAVFHHYKPSNRVFRISGISKSEFQQILLFIYSGDMCIIKSDSALAIFKHADLLGLNGMKDVARSKVYAFLSPENVWKVYKVAKETGDVDLEKAANLILSLKTSEILKHPGINDISKDILLGLVSQNYLQIGSEYQLYEAIVKWAMHQAQKQKLEVTPEVLREIIGADIMKQIRFASMTSAEFAQVYMGFKILAYEEILPIIFNINDPGTVPLPSTVSDKIQKRNDNILPGTFRTINYLNLCKDQISSDSVFLTKSQVFSTRYSSFRLHKVYFQRADNARDYCAVEEHFDIVIADSDGKIIQRTPYDDIPGCNLNFGVSVNKIDIGDFYQIYVEFRAEREYPINNDVIIDCSSNDYDEDENGQMNCKVESSGFITNLSVSES